MALRIDEWRLKMTENVNRTLSKMDRGAESTAAKFTRMQDRINQSVVRGAQSIRTGLSGAWKGASADVGQYARGIVDALPLPPSMTAALGGMSAPLLAAVGLVGVLGMGLAKGVQAAEAYGVPFREFRNLNLDKTKAELDAVNDRVLNLAKTEGLDATKLITGVYDIQSTIGEFGPHVERMVADVGVAARALNMDFTTAVSGVGKALVQFKLPLTEVNRLLESNAKTVQVGVVTFDELSKVQTEYAGAAASANQQLDTANKVFALLTTNTKNADIAATMAKAAFQDLGRADTMAGLKKIGVNVFDANGAMRQTDEILRDLVPIFRQMSDQQFAALKEEIGGSEGLRGLLDMTKASGTEVLRVLDTFDNTKFSLAESIAQSNADLDIMSQKLDGQMSASWVKLGQAVTPFWRGVKMEMATFLNQLTTALEAIGNGIGSLFRSAPENLAADAKQVYQTQLAAMEPMAKAFGTLNAQQQARQIEQWRALQLKMTREAGAEKQPLNRTEKFMRVRALNDFVTQQQEAMKVPQGRAGLGAPDVPGAPVNAGAPVKGMSGIAGAPAAGTPAVPGTNTANDPFAKLFSGKKQGDSSGVSQGVNQVTGGGKEVRNVTVVIKSLIGEMTIRVDSVRDMGSEIKRVVTQELVNATRGSELVLSND